MSVLQLYRTYALTGSTKYGVWVSGILTWFFDDFWAIAKRCCKQFAIDRKLIAKSLKWRIFVHAHDGEFVQCVSPIVDQLLWEHKFRKRKAVKMIACGSSENRNEQFEKIESLKTQYFAEGNPVISMDSKKKC